MDNCNEQNSSVCPRCGQLADPISRRLIVEICGHQKCRQCIIKEENGCEDCNKIGQNEIQSNDLLLSAKTNDWENDGIQIDFDMEKCPSPNEIRSNQSSNNEEDPIQNVDRNETRKADKIGKRNRLKYPNHLTVTKVDGKTIFHCSVCNKNFKSLNNRKYHFYCDKSIAKPWKCNQCNKSFITKSHLNYHEKTHVDGQCFPCELCSCTFLRLQSLRKHITKKHDRKFRFVCDECGQKFMYKDEMTLHKNKHNNILPFSCDVCNKCFSTKSNLKQHSQIHQGFAHSCTKCDKKFTQICSLKAHQIIHSNVQCQLECKNCPKIFVNQKSFDRHMKTHSGSKSYKCPICDTVSSRRDNIQRHIRNLHSDQNVSELINSISCNEKGQPLIGKQQIHTSKSMKSVDTVVEDATTSNDSNKLKASSSFCSVIKYTGRPVSEIENPSNTLANSSNEMNEIQLKDSNDTAKTTQLTIETKFEQDNPKTNLKIYRQLLSPYLKPPPEVLQKNSQSNQIEFQNIQPIRHFKKPFKKDHLEIYRRILMPDRDIGQTEQQQQQQHQQNPIEINMSNERSQESQLTNLQMTNDSKRNDSKTSETDFKETLQHRNNNNNGGADEFTRQSFGDRDQFTEIHWRKRTSQSFNRMAF